MDVLFLIPQASFYLSYVDIITSLSLKERIRKGFTLVHEGYKCYRNNTLLKEILCSNVKGKWYYWFQGRDRPASSMDRQSSNIPKLQTITSIDVQCIVAYRGCSSLGAVGAMAPTNFQKDAFGTHEISNFMYIATSYLIDWHPWNFLVTLERHSRSQIPNAYSCV